MTSERVAATQPPAHSPSPVAGAREAVAHAARSVLEKPAWLPPWLFYDQRGSELFEAITRLPEYTLTRAEREILETHADELVELAGADRPLAVVELGAGTATKTQLLLGAIARRAVRCTYLPIELSASAVTVATTRLAREVPGVAVRAVRATYTDAFALFDGGELLADLQPTPRRWALFLGSSIGNYDDAGAVALLSELARSVRPEAGLLLGTDCTLDPAVQVPAYDDAQGVTAAFNLNLLARLNRELGADFDLDAWRHGARWNERLARVEMHLIAQRAQVVTLPDVGTAAFAEGESIHTESSHKYDRAHVDRLFTASGFVRVRTFTDRAGRFDLHQARLA